MILTLCVCTGDFDATLPAVFGSLQQLLCHHLERYDGDTMSAAFNYTCFSSTVYNDGHWYLDIVSSKHSTLG
jgi:hypothetical protein